MNNNKTKKEETLQLFRFYISKYVEDCETGQREKFDIEELSQLLTDVMIDS